MARLLHAADIHLDSPLKGLERYEGAPAERIRVATRRAFERLVELAVTERVDVVLLAGDLYDGDWTDNNPGLFLCGLLATLRDAGIEVVAIKGNHDAENKMTRELRLPENVRLLASDRAETVEFEHLGLVVHGQSYKTGAVKENLAAEYPAAVRGMFNVGLLHTGLTGIEGHEPYAPCTVEGLRAKGYDYWALGHIHKRSEPCVDPLVVFPGNLQGRHIKETGEKGAVLVVAEAGRAPVAAFHRLDVVRWEVCRLEGGGLESEDGLLEAWEQEVERLLEGESDERMLAVRLRVEGPSEIHQLLGGSGERLKAELRRVANDRADDRLWVERVQFATQPMREVEVPDGPISELLELIKELGGSEEGLKELGGELDEVAKKVGAHLRHEPDAPALDDPAWLREVLGSVEPLLREILTAGVKGKVTP